MEVKRTSAKEIRTKYWVLPHVIVFTLLLLVTAGTLVAQECEPPTGLRDSWQVSPSQLQTLADQPGEPLLIVAEVGEPDNSSGELQSVARMHALFNTPMEAFVQALRAVEEQDDYLPRLEESILLCSSGRPLEYGRVRQKLSFRLLFFGKDYEYELHYFFDESTRGEFLVWWQLAEALDGQIEHTDGVWYFKEVSIDGTNYTYMTYATRTVFRKETLGLRAAIERFGERDVRTAMLALNEEARRRLQ